MTLLQDNNVCFPNLMVLNLDSVNCSKILADGSISFPVLKILGLIRVKYGGNGSDCLSKFIGSCPFLEGPLIIKAFDDNLSNIEMHTLALTSPEINFSNKFR